MKKKAALTLLRLFRKHPDVMPVTDWAERIVSLMDDYDLVIWALDNVFLCITDLFVLGRGIVSNNTRTHIGTEPSNGIFWVLRQGRAQTQADFD